MNFLGHLGIDVKLLVAQIINFGLLLWLLNKFLYKPVIKRIEKDEEELNQAQIQKKELEQEKENLDKQKVQTIKETKQRVEGILKEAEEISQERQEKTQSRAEKEAKQIIVQTKKELETQKVAVKEEVLDELSKEISKNIQEGFSSEISVAVRQDFQDALFSDLISRINSLSLKTIEGSELSAVVNKLTSGEKSQSSKEYKEKFEDLLSEKIGPVVLEYVFPLDQKQIKELKETVLKKIGIEPKIVTKQNKNLISGFRFEILGMIVESNLSNIINNAANVKTNKN